MTSGVPSSAALITAHGSSQCSLTCPADCWHTAAHGQDQAPARPSHREVGRFQVGLELGRSIRSADPSLSMSGCRSSWRSHRGVGLLVEERLLQPREGLLEFSPPIPDATTRTLCPCVKSLVMAENVCSAVTPGRTPLVIARIESPVRTTVGGFTARAGGQESSEKGARTGAQDSQRAIDYLRSVGYEFEPRDDIRPQWDRGSARDEVLRGENVVLRHGKPCYVNPSCHGRCGRRGFDPCRRSPSPEEPWYTTDVTLLWNRRRGPSLALNSRRLERGRRHVVTCSWTRRRSRFGTTSTARGFPARSAGARCPSTLLLHQGRAPGPEVFRAACYDNSSPDRPPSGPASRGRPPRESHPPTPAS